MNFRLSFAVLVCVATLGLGAPSAEPDGHPKKCDGKPYCEGTTSSVPADLCGDPRLGPKKLPSHPPLSDILFDYNRFGGLCPGAFLERWFNTTSGFYNFPPDSGFQLNTLGDPIDGTQSLAVGLVVDRFGSEFGKFLAPVDTPYAQRSLPPSSLDTPTSDPTVPFNYHVYEVIKSFDVLSGPIAGWFGQPGQGTQYQTTLSIMDLISGGFLERVDVKSKRGMEKIRRAFEKRALYGSQ